VEPCAGTPRVKLGQATAPTDIPQNSKKPAFFSLLRHFAHSLDRKKNKDDVHD